MNVSQKILNLNNLEWIPYAQKSSFTVDEISIFEGDPKEIVLKSE